MEYFVVLNPNKGYSKMKMFTLEDGDNSLFFAVFSASRSSFCFPSDDDCRGAHFYLSCLKEDSVLPRDFYIPNFEPNKEYKHILNGFYEVKKENEEAV